MSDTVPGTPDLTTTAMVLNHVSHALAPEHLDLAPLEGRRVLVEIKASGVCHSDLHFVDGDWDGDLPMVLGHEGAGIVRAIGPGVSTVSVGDHVILNWFAPCHQCTACLRDRPWTCTGTTAINGTLPDDGTTAFRRPDGQEVRAMMGLGTFAGKTVVTESAVVKVSDNLPFEVAALIGCATTTGVGAVLNTAHVTEGSHTAVIGVGGVGQAVIMGLHVSHAGVIIAVDMAQDRLELAQELGATHTLRGDDPDLVTKIHELTDGGADFAFEAIGHIGMIEMLPQLLRAGGVGVVVGMAAMNRRVSYDPFDLADQAKTIIGCNYGSSIPARDFPRFAEMYLSGDLPLDKLIHSRRPLAQASGALQDLRDAIGLRTILIP